MAPDLYAPRMFRSWNKEIHRLILNQSRGNPTPSKPLQMLRSKPPFSSQHSEVGTKVGTHNKWTFTIKMCWCSNKREKRLFLLLQLLHSVLIKTWIIDEASLTKLCVRWFFKSYDAVFVTETSTVKSSCVRSLFCLFIFVPILIGLIHSSWSSLFIHG